MPCVLFPSPRTLGRLYYSIYSTGHVRRVRVNWRQALPRRKAEGANVRSTPLRLPALFTMQCPFPSRPAQLQRIMHVTRNLTPSDALQRRACPDTADGSAPPTCVPCIVYRVPCTVARLLTYPIPSQCLVVASIVRRGGTRRQTRYQTVLASPRIPPSAASPVPSCLPCTQSKCGTVYSPPPRLLLTLHLPSVSSRLLAISSRRQTGVHHVLTPSLHSAP